MVLSFASPTFKCLQKANLWNIGTRKLSHFPPPWFRLNASKLLASKLFVLFYKVAHKLEAVCDTRVFAANGYMDLCARRTLGWTRYIYVHSRLNLLGNILSFLMLRCPSITLICKWRYCLLCVHTRARGCKALMDSKWQRGRRRGWLAGLPDIAYISSFLFHRRVLSSSLFWTLDNLNIY